MSTKAVNTGRRLASYVDHDACYFLKCWRKSGAEVLVPVRCTMAAGYTATVENRTLNINQTVDLREHRLFTHDDDGHTAG